MIVLDENSWAFGKLNSNDIGQNRFETLRRVANYYRTEKGYDKNITEKALEQFLMKSVPFVSIPMNQNVIDAAVSYAFSHDPIMVDSIPITDKEIEKIESLKSKQAQRLAFTILVLSKYWDIVNNTDTHWVNCKYSEAMKLANVSTSKKRQCAMYASLVDDGLIALSKKIDSDNVRVLFQEDGQVVLKITDLRNIGYQYMMFLGGPFSVCQECGITFKTECGVSGGRPKKYCPSCATKVKTQQSVNSVMRHRHRELKSSVPV